MIMLEPEAPGRRQRRIAGLTAWRYRRVPVPVALAVIVLSVAVTACGTSKSSSGETTQKALTPVTFAVTGPSSAWDFLYVAQSAGLFAKNGIAVTIDSESDSAIVPGILSGSFQATPLISEGELAALAGQPMVNLMTVENRDDAGLAVDSGITSISQLAGKTVVTGEAATGPYITLEELLARNNLTGKVKILSLQTNSAQQTAFLSGQAQALFVSYSNVVAAAAKLPGASIIVTPKQAGPIGGFAGLSVSRSYLQNHRGTVSDIIKSILEAVKFVQTEPTKTQAIFEKTFGFTKAQATLLYADAKAINQLQPVPTQTELTNDARAKSASLHKTITESQLASTWETSLATQVYKQLNCPNVC